jgi:hypothetical protein
LGTQGDVRLAVPGKVHPTKVAHAAIRVDKMPAMRAYSTRRIPGPIVGMGWNRSHNIGAVGRRVVYGLKCMWSVRRREREG